MKNLNLYPILLLVIFSAPALFAQDYITKITHQSCECLSEISETEDSDRFNLELGLCIINASTPYKKELKRDHNIDLDNINVDGTRLGELIGIKMAGVCPEEILRMTNTSDDEDYEEMSNYVSGTVTKIEKEQFVVLSLKDDSGKTLKLYWFCLLYTSPSPRDRG